MLLGLSFMACFSRIYNPTIAYAATDVNVILSSATYGGVCVTTGTVIRVDTRRRGGDYTTIPSTRIGIEIQNQDATYNIWCAYDTQFTTFTTGPNGVSVSSIGFRLGPDSVRYVGMIRGAQYNCQAADAAGTACVPLHVEHIHKE